MSMASLPPGFYPSYETCSEVSLYCPVEATTLGYFPVKGLNIFLAIAYGLAAALTLGVGVWKRTWGFSLAVASGCALECVGKCRRAPSRIGVDLPRRSNAARLRWALAPGRQPME